MFIKFFENLRQHKVPVSLREYLTFLESVSLELCTYDIDHFYFLGRIIMVKDERHLDKFDRAFSKTFAGIESLSIRDLIDSLDVPEAWLKKLTERVFDKEELEKIAEQKRQAEAAAFLQASEGFIKADPNLGLVGILAQGAAAAAPGLSDVASIRQAEKNIGRNIRKADIEDVLTIKQLENLEAERQRNLAAAAADLAADAEKGSDISDIFKMIDRKTGFTVDKETGTVLLNNQGVTSDVQDAVFNFTNEAIQVGNEFRKTYPTEWRAKTSEWIANNKPQFPEEE